MSQVPFDPAAIRQLAAILTETGLTEIEIAEKDSRIRVVRALAPASVAPATFAAAPAPVAAPAMGAPTSEPAATDPGAIPSPMVGVVYLSPEPGTAPFVTVGQTVAAGQTLLLIEAMKTFNQIKAPRAGTVTRILVSSGAQVEYGEPILILE